MIDLRRASIVLGVLLVLGALGFVGLTQLRADDSTPTIDKADLLSEGDGVCVQARADVEAQIEAAQTAEGSSQSDTAVIRQVIVPVVREMFDDVEALGSPADDRDLLGDLYERIDDLLDEVEAEGLDGDLLAEQETLVAELQDYGFQECGFSA